MIWENHEKRIIARDHVSRILVFTRAQFRSCPEISVFGEKLENKEGAPPRSR